MSRSTQQMSASSREHNCPRKTFHVRIPLSQINMHVGNGSDRESLSSCMSDKEGTPMAFDIHSLVILPVQFHTLQHEDTLFYLRYMDRDVEIRPSNISCFIDLAYWSGCEVLSNRQDLVTKMQTSRRIIISSLRRASWKLHRPSDNEDDAYITATGQRKAVDIPMVSLGWYHVLPDYIIATAFQNCWRITMGNPQDEVKEIPEEAETYADVQHAARLMHIPVIMTSVKGDDKPQHISVDIRDLRNLDLLYEDGEWRYGCNRECRSPLDLFDAMMAFGATWRVEGNNVSLPSLPRPPESPCPVTPTTAFPLLRVQRESVDVLPVRPSLETAFPFLSKETQTDILSYMFPSHRRLDESHKKELFRRLEAMTGFGRTHLGHCSWQDGLLACILPRSISRL